MFFAHTRQGQCKEEWDQLDEHLCATALRAREFFQHAPEVGYWAGLWHDIGKYQPEFQKYLLSASDADACNEQRHGRVQHSIVGAALANEKEGEILIKLATAWAIAAHHGSLKSRSDLLPELKGKGRELLDSCREHIPPEILDAPAPNLPPGILPQSNAAQMLWVRMLLSALSDADMLVSEAWDRGEERALEADGIAALRDRFFTQVADAERRRISEGRKDSALNRMRAQVLAACIRAAEDQPGQFSLTVPTGGGKTLSSFAFALQHASLKDRKRIIVVIPFTSIIEQTASILRAYLGPENVIEHHSSIEFEHDTVRNQWACENWDAPVIVTTSVQFFESLYAARKSRCRKLHNIADSVIILDEVQSYPVDLLKPIRRVLGLLSEHFGCTVVHCTATQPTPEEGTPIGPEIKPSPRPIISNPAPLFAVVKDRFRIVVESSLEQPLPLEDLAERFQRHPTALLILHSRREAEQVARLSAGTWHLSARMCAAHRKDVLDKVRAELRTRRPVRLVATQLIEAGVDISFPVVFRALAGLETLAQAAGRCNRELDGSGEFHVFLAPSQPPSSSLKRGLETTLEFLRDPEFKLDLNNPALFPRYFREVLNGALVQTDAPGIGISESRFDFPEVEEKFRMIGDEGQSVLAPYGLWAPLLDRLRYDLRHHGHVRQSMRALQRYFVQLRRSEIDKLRVLGAIEPLFHSEGAEPTVWTVCEGAKVYDDRFGFGWQGIEHPEPEDLIA